MANIEVTILGSGTSSGVPIIACNCPTCTSTDHRDKRLRTSVWIQIGDTSIVIDTSTDFRQQCLQAGINKLDAVIYTHHHYDHIAGFDDLRAYNYAMRRPVDIYLNHPTLAELQRMFNYAFKDVQETESSTPQVKEHVINEGPFKVKQVTITPLKLNHGKMKVNGYRIAKFAYCTDCNQIDVETIRQLNGLDVLVLDALRLTPHPTHFTLEQAIETATEIGAKTTYFTHIAHEILHDKIENNLPANMHLAYDGLKFIIPN